MRMRNHIYIVIFIVLKVALQTGQQILTLKQAEIILYSVTLKHIGKVGSWVEKAS